MENESTTPNPRERLHDTIVMSVAYLKVDPVMAALSDMNQLLTGRVEGDFGADDATKESVRAKLSKFVTDAHGLFTTGYGECSIILGDGRSKLELLMDDRELSISTSRDSESSVKDKWAALKSNPVSTYL